MNDINDINLLKEYSSTYGLDLNEQQLKQFSVYYDFLIKYNEKVNLTAIIKLEDVIIKHFLDSIMIAKYVNLMNGKKLIDVGTGAGFPGVALKILEPQLKITLLDSLNKRIIFLNELACILKLDFDIIHARAQEQSKEMNYKKKYDIVVSRAAMNLTKFIECSSLFLRVSGIMVALKGYDVGKEIYDAKEAMEKSQIITRNVHKFLLPNSNRRSIVIFEKLNFSEFKRK